MRSEGTARFVWRKLSAAKWEDAWLERLAPVRERLAITHLAGRKTVRLEAFALTKAEAEELAGNFGGEIVAQKSDHQAATQPPRPAIRIREKLLIVATEREAREVAAPEADRAVVVIPAAMAFGTGDHATTSTCLRLLSDIADELRGVRWEMLDLGTGTGVLAISARKLGAHRVDAADFDKAAVRVARDNVRLNAVTNVVIRAFDARTWQPDRRWNVVCANLFSGLLVELAPKLLVALAPGGSLIFSGVLREQEAEVVAALRAQSFELRSIVRKGKWVSGIAGTPAPPVAGASD